MRNRNLALCALCFTPLLLISDAQGNPLGGSVVGGSGNATIMGQGTSSTTISQFANRVIINWQDFSIGKGEITRFIQPSSGSWALNRILSGNPSQIYGSLQANGHVFVINPNGILVGPSGQIDTKGFTASTYDIPNAKFFSGAGVTLSGNSTASIQNQGTINALGGDVFLIAHSVENDGAISAAGGTVGLAAGSEVRLVQSGAERISVLAGNSSAPAQVGVNNQGTIQAASAELKAAGGNIYALAINNGGVVRANTVVSEGGHIYLRASGGNIQNSGTLSASGTSGGTVVVDGGHNSTAAATVTSSGTIDARGDSAAGHGGKVEILGDHVGLFDNAQVDVSGTRGGGTVLMGGDEHGANAAIQNAQRTYVSADAVIRADALNSGNGGKVVVWADEMTGFYGHISALGGASGGNGGFAEVSAPTLLYSGLSDLRAPAGSVGSLLLDPKVINIQTTTTPDTLTGNQLFTDNPAGTVTFDPVNTIVNALSTANLQLQANTDINIINGFTSASAHNLTLNAGRSIILANGVAISLGGSFTATINDAGATVADRDPGVATFSMGTASSISALGVGGINISAGTLVGDSSNPGTTVAANTGNMTLTSLSTKPAASGTGIAGGAITVSDNAAALKNITISGLVDASGSDATSPGKDGGPSGTVTLNASGNLSVAAVTADGGAGNGNGNGGAGGGISLTAGAGSALTLNSSVAADGGVSGAGNSAVGGAGGTVGLASGASISIGLNNTVSANGGSGGGNNAKGGNANSAALTLNAGTTITQDGALSANGGNGAGTGNSGNGGGISLTAGTGISLTQNVSANAGSGPAGTAGTVTLDSTTSGGASQTGGNITGGNLLLEGAGAFNLNQAGNNIGLLAANVSGAVTYLNAGALIIGTVAAVNGVTSGNNAISLSTANGALTVNHTAAGNDIEAGTSTASLTAGGDNSLLTISATAKVNGGGGVTLAGDRISVAGTVTTTGIAALHETTSGRAITLGTAAVNALTGSGGTLGLLNADINNITAGTLRIGDGNSGNLNITAAIAPAGASTLSLQSGGTISEGLAGTIGTSITPLTSLALVSGGSITLTRQNFVGTLAANAGAGLQFNDAQTLTLDTVDGVSSVSANNAALTITAAGPITVNKNVAAGSGSVSLTAKGDNSLLTIAGGANVSGSSSVTLAADRISVAGTVTTAGAASLHETTATRPITIGTGAVNLSTVSGGTLGLLNSDINNITAGTLVIGDANSGNVSVTAAINPAGAPALSLQSGGQISQTVGSTITVSGLASFTSAGSGAAGNITLQEANSFGSLALSSANGAAVSVTEAGAATLDNVAVNAGTLTITAGGDITQVNGKSIISGGATTFTAPAGHSILLGNVGNSFGAPLSLLASGVGNLLNVTLRNSGPLALPTLTLNGALNVTANGSITENGPLSVLFGPSTFTIDTATANVLLGTQANHFDGQAVTINSINGGVVQDVSFRNVDATALIPSLPANLRNLTLQFDTAPISLPGLTVNGALDVIAGGNITESGALNVTAGASTFTIDGVVASVLLGTQANHFDAQTVTINSISGGTVQDVSFDNADVTASFPVMPGGLRNVSVTFDTAPMLVPALTLSGALNLRAGNNIMFQNNIIAASLSAHSGTGGNGNLTFAGGLTIDADTQSYQAGSGSGTTASANLTGGTPAFRDTAGSAAPLAFTYRQDAAITAANVPSAAQFGGTDPAALTLESDGGAVQLPTLTLPGSLVVIAHGNITEAGLLTVNAGPSTFSIESVVGSVLLGNQANHFGAQTVTINSVNGGTVQDVSLRNVDATALFPVLPANLRNLTLEFDAAPITLPAETLSGALSVTAGGDISETGPLSVTGGPSTFSISGVVGNVLLGSQANHFAGQTVTINGVGGGTVQDVSFRNVDGGALTPSLPANLRNLTLELDAAPVALPALTLSGVLDVIAGGNITENGAISATAGASTFTIDGVVGSVLLGNQANHFAGRTVTINSINGGTVQDVSLRNVDATALFPVLPANLRNLTLEFDAAPVTLPALTLSGALDVIAGGSITEVGPLSVSGGPNTFSIDGVVGSVLLGSQANHFAGQTVTINAINGGTVQDVSFRNVDGGAATPSLPANLRNLTLELDAAPVALPGLTLSGVLDVIAGGNITENGAVSATAGASTFTIDGTVGSVLLGSQANHFAGQTVTINSINGGTVQDVSLRNVDATALFPVLPANLRNLTLDFDAAPITLPAETLSGTLSVTAGGDISETGPLSVTGGASTFSINGVMGSVLLGSQANHFAGQTVTINGVNGGTVQDVSFRNVDGGAQTPSIPATLRNLTLELDAAPVALPAVTLSGALDVIAGGNITENGAVSATAGASTFTIEGVVGSVLLGSQANHFAGQTVTINAINGGTVQDVSLRNKDATAVFPSLPGGLRNLTLDFDAAAITLPALAVSGTLDVTSGGDITESGPIGADILQATANGNVILDAANQVNKVAGSVAGAGNSFSFTDQKPINVGVVVGVVNSGITTVNGNVTLTADTININAVISTGGRVANVVLQPVTAGRDITLGTKTVAALSLTQTELEEVTANILQVGNPSAGTISGVNKVTTPPTVTKLVVVGNGTTVNSFSAAISDLSAVNGVVLAPKLKPVNFSSAAISSDEALKYLEPGAIGTLWLQLPFPQEHEEEYVIEDISKWTSGRIAAAGTTTGPQMPK